MAFLVFGDSLLARQICEMGNQEMGERTFIRLAANYALALEYITNETVEGIINCAQFDFWSEAGGIEAVERNSTEAVVATVTAGKLAIAARGANVPFVHVSSHLVFSGSGGPYSADEIPNPSQALGMALLWAENAVQAMSDNYVIVRVGWLYGRDRPDSYPVRVLTETYEEDVKGTKAKRHCRVPNKPMGTPALDTEVADLIAHHTAGLTSGSQNHRIVHVGPPESSISWFEFCAYIGSPSFVGTSWNPMGHLYPVQQGLIPTPGWRTSTYLRSAANFLRSMGDG